MSFAHLHVHSYYSLLDGIDSPTELARAAKKAGQPAIAITDHGVMSGHRELHRACKKLGIKPIYGLEAYISPTDRFDKRSKADRKDGTSAYNHIILLAKNQKGYENINAMSEIAWTEGFHYKPRIDTDLLLEYSEGVIVLTGCLSGIPAKLIEQGKQDEAEQWLARLHGTFGDDLYVEVQAHNPEEINEGLRRLAASVGVKMAATSDAHRAWEKDKDLQDAFLVLSTYPDKAKGAKYEMAHGKRLMDALDTLYPNRTMTFKEWNLYIQSREELEADFDGWGGDEIYESTLEIADKIEEYEYYEGKDLLPKVVDDPADELETLCLEGMIRMGLRKPEYHARLQEELAVIKGKNFSKYFLILHDVVNWCEQQEILVGPGRGSAVGSLVCYLLGITHADPLEYDLLFARFLNAERNDYPDVDMDFPKEHRSAIKEYVNQKYGHTANIITYGHFSDKSALQAAGRLFCISPTRMNKLTKKIEKFEDYEESTDEYVVKFRKRYPAVLPLAKRLDGRISQSGMHAGGVVISSEPISKYAPMETKDDPDGDGRVPVVALDMRELEDIGLIKFDFLANKSLDIVAKTAKKVGMTFDDIRGIPLNDEECLRNFDEAKTTGVFQCDTNPYRKVLEQFPVKSFIDVAISNALVRPGAMNTVGKDYIERANGRQRVTFVHDDMKEYTEYTLGEIITQEQVMLAAVHIGGMSWSDADHLRKIIGKKQDPAKFAKYKEQWMQGATKKITSREAAKLWTDFEAHAGYSFNMSHSVAYSMISMWTMWFRLNHPQEYMASLLNMQDKASDVTKLLIACERLGIPVYKPDINESAKSFTEYEDGVIFGLCDIKYIADKSYANIVRHRPYTSVEQLIEVKNTKYSGVGSNQVQALEWTGALRNIGGPEASEAKMYEYLGLPTFDVPELENEELINPVADFVDDEDTYLLAGMVQDVKRNKNWTLIDIVDDSGDVGFFDDGGSPVQKGEFYYFLVHNNRVTVMYTPDELIQEDEEKQPALTKYLQSDIMELLGNRSRYVLHIEKGKTRSGRKKAVVTAASEEGLHTYMVYSRNYDKMMMILEVGKSFDFKLSTTDWGAEVINDAR